MSFDVITRTHGTTRTFLRKGTKFAKSRRCCCEDDPRKLPPFGETQPCQICKGFKSPKKVQCILSGFECLDAFSGGRGCDDSFDNPHLPPFPKAKFKPCCDALNKTVICGPFTPFGSGGCSQWAGRVDGTQFQYMPHSDGIIYNFDCFIPYSPYVYPFNFASLRVDILWGPPGNSLGNPNNTYWVYALLGQGIGSTPFTLWGADLGVPFQIFSNPDPDRPRPNCFFSGLSLNVISGTGLCRTPDPLILSAA